MRHPFHMEFQIIYMSCENVLQSNLCVCFWAWYICTHREHIYKSNICVDEHSLPHCWWYKKITKKSVRTSFDWHIARCNTNSSTSSSSVDRGSGKMLNEKCNWGSVIKSYYYAAAYIEWLPAASLCFISFVLFFAQTILLYEVLMAVNSIEYWYFKFS